MYLKDELQIDSRAIDWYKESQDKPKIQRLKSFKLPERFNYVQNNQNASDGIGAAAAAEIHFTISGTDGAGGDHFS